MEAGRALAQRRAAEGETVLDVPAKLAARVRGYSRGHGRKTGQHDAVWAGLAARDGTGVLPVTGDGALVSLRLRGDRRGELTAPRTQAVGRRHRLLAEPTPWREAPRADGEQGPGAAGPPPPRR